MTKNQKIRYWIKQDKRALKRCKTLEEKNDLLKTIAYWKSKLN